MLLLYIAPLKIAIGFKKKTLKKLSFFEFYWDNPTLEHLFCYIFQPIYLYPVFNGIGNREIVRSFSETDFSSK